MSEQRKRPDPRRRHLDDVYRFQGFVPKDENMTPEQWDQLLARRAMRAREILGNPHFTETLKEMYTHYADRWFETMPGQTEEREDLYFRARGLQEVVLNLQGQVNEYAMRKATQSRGQVGP